MAIIRRQCEQCRQWITQETSLNDRHCRNLVVIVAHVVKADGRVSYAQGLGETSVIYSVSSFPIQTANASNSYRMPGKDDMVAVRKPDWGRNGTISEAEYAKDIKATWLGHACFLVEFPTPSSTTSTAQQPRGLRVLFDPSVQSAKICETY